MKAPSMRRRATFLLASLTDPAAVTFEARNEKAQRILEKTWQEGAAAVLLATYAPDIGKALRDLADTIDPPKVSP